jgi:hypothetical protein
MTKNHQFKDPCYEIYAIGYYSGFYSYLKYKIEANGGHFECYAKNEER